MILEGTDRVGGLATSFIDEAGFTWDIGGHVITTRWSTAMAGEYSTLRRAAWVWMEDRFIAYPFQNNIRELEPQTVFECLVGAVEAQRAAGTATPANFHEWIYATMGAGIADDFMIATPA